MSEAKQILIREIGVEPALVIRQSLDPETVRRYATAMLAGAAFPPLDVAQRGGGYVLLDGRHRLAAAQQIGKVSITARVARGTDAQYLLHAVRVNTAHGKPLTDPEQTDCARRLLKAGIAAREIEKAMYLTTTELEKMFATGATKTPASAAPRTHQNGRPRTHRSPVAIVSDKNVAAALLDAILIFRDSTVGTDPDTLALVTKLQKCCTRHLRRAGVAAMSEADAKRTAVLDTYLRAIPINRRIQVGEIMADLGIGDEREFGLLSGAIGRLMSEGVLRRVAQDGFQRVRN